jgi:hypothetical protein
MCNKIVLSCFLQWCAFNFCVVFTFLLINICNQSHHLQSPCILEYILVGPISQSLIRLTLLPDLWILWLYKLFRTDQGILYTWWNRKKELLIKRPISVRACQVKRKSDVTFVRMHLLPWCSRCLNRDSREQ